MPRVSIPSEFKRGRPAALVALLSGRNFESRTSEEAIAEKSSNQLQTGVLRCMNENNFKRFLMIVRSAGFIEPGMIRSQNAINFAYILYLVLTAQKTNAGQIEKYVRRWLVMSILTGRYSASPESQIDLDIRRINEFGMEKYIVDVEDAQLSG